MWDSTEKGYAVLRPEQMVHKRSLPALIPLVAIQLSALPNMNDILYMTPRARAGTVKMFRNKGYKIGLDVCRELGIPIIVKQKPGGGKSTREFAIEVASLPLYYVHIFTILDVWYGRSIKDPTKGDRRRDVYNLVVKATIDGLTDAGLWEDDNTDHHTDFWVTYRGLGDKGSMVLSFYSWAVD